MKFERNPKYNTIAIYAFLVAAAIILFGLLLVNLGNMFEGVKNILGYITTVLYGFVFAFLLNPMVKFYDRHIFSKVAKEKGGLRKKVRKGLSILLTYITTLALFFLFLLLVVPQLGRSLVDVRDQIPLWGGYLQNAYDSIIAFLENMPFSEDSESQALLRNITAGILNALEDSLKNLSTWLGTWLEGFVPKVWTAAASITTTLINAVLGLIISIYFLLDKEKLFAQLRKITAAVFPKRASDFLYGIAVDTNKVFSGFIIGKLIDSFLVGLICFAFMAFLHWDLAVLISVIVGVFNMIPYFGPIIGAVPGVVLLLLVDPVKGLIFLVFIILLQQFDGNIMGPKILGESTGLSPLMVIFAILFFNGVFGLIGMFIGVPLFSMIYLIIKRVVSRRLKQKELSTDTRDYASEDNPLIP
ncbi:MAG: AI-2E family transporter [Oscillospiraceae bacterium]